MKEEGVKEISMSYVIRKPRQHQRDRFCLGQTLRSQRFGGLLMCCEHTEGVGTWQLMNECRIRGLMEKKNGVSKLSFLKRKTKVESSVQDRSSA